jgi:predicted transcriptional regulator
VTRRGSGELEAAVLDLLRGSPTPLTPAQIRADLDGLAYNTVHTILRRLCDKGLARRTSRAGRSVYVAAHEAAEWAAGQMRAVLDRSGDRQAILLRFVSSLDPDAEEFLRSALHERSGPGSATSATGGDQEER